jgi:hypothetical protein
MKSRNPGLSAQGEVRQRLNGSPVMALRQGPIGTPKGIALPLTIVPPISHWLSSCHQALVQTGGRASPVGSPGPTIAMTSVWSRMQVTNECVVAQGEPLTSPSISSAAAAT